MSPVVPEDHQKNGLFIHLIEQMIRESFEIRPPKPAWVEMVTAGISFDGFQHRIQLVPERLKNPV